VADQPKGGHTVIAVDGPSGSGKSSVSRGAATELGLRYLDTGAMYRAVTWWMLERRIDVSDSAAVAARAAEALVAPGTDPASPTITLDGRDVSAEIRRPEVTGAVSAVSAVPEVRRLLLTLQRTVIGAGGIVVEGRDIGTVVCPDADLKVFLTASAQARAARRSRELAGAGHSDAAPSVTLDDLARRDAVDSTRAVSPLRRADDAVVVDATELSLEETIAEVVRLARSIRPVSDR
jgi:CMP/dCMP kinase